jgi:hypothetical protein
LGGSNRRQLGAVGDQKRIQARVCPESTPGSSSYVFKDSNLDVKSKTEVETLLEKRAAIELFPPYTPGFYSSIFVIPKKNSEK